MLYDKHCIIIVFKAAKSGKEARVFQFKVIITAAIFAIPTSKIITSFSEVYTFQLSRVSLDCPAKQPNVPVSRKITNSVCCVVPRPARCVCVPRRDI